MALLLAAACGKGDKAPPAGGSAASGVASGAGVAKAPSAEVLRALAVTEVSATTRVDAVSAGPLVVVTDKSIVIDGMALAAVSGGAIEAASLDAASGHIRPVKAWAESWATAARTTGALPAVSIAITPGVPSSLLVQVLASFNAAGARDFGLIVRTPDGPGAVPLHLPVAPAVPVVDGAQPLQMILSMTPARALLWSMSGLEGTLGSPKLDLTPSAGGVWLATVRDDLADIVKKRWQGKTRPATEESIVIQFEDALAAGDLVAAAATVRHDAQGGRLFPDVLLAAGFQAPKVPGKVADADTPAEPAPGRDRAEMAVLEEEASRYAAALVGESDSYIDRDMSRTAPGGDLATQIDNVRNSGAQVAIGGGSRGTRGDGDPRTGAGIGPTVDGPGSGSGSGLATPSGRISIANKRALDDTSLTADDVLRKLQSMYMAGLKRCYKNELKKDPELRGKITRTFTVNEHGRNTAGKADGVSADLEACLEGLMSNWRFPAPKDADGEAAEASFSIVLQVVPD